ncbi:MAG: OmpA family protein [Nitrospirota bacterium]
MNKSFQSILTILLGCSFLMLLGCPKQVSPERKTTRITRRVPTKIVPPTPEVDNSELGNTLAPLNEEEIAPIAKLGDASSDESFRENIKGKPSVLKDIFFELDQWTIGADDIAIVEENIKWMVENPASKVIIHGHGDNRGTNEYNLVLGEKRANAVKEAMVTLGVKSSRLSTVSYGEERPFCSEEGDSCHQKNRRVQHRVE